MASPPDPGPDQAFSGLPGASSGSLTERRKAETRREIARAAARLFAGQGLRATRAEDIAQAAGIAPRTFYRYFATKEEAVAPLYAAGAQRWAEAVRTAPADLPLPAALEHATRYVLTPGSGVSAASWEWVRTLVRLTHTSPALRRVWAEVCQSAEQTLADVLAARLRPRATAAGRAAGPGAGPGAGSDVGPGAGSDAGRAAGPDAGPAVGLGAGPGAGSDVGPRAGSDAGLGAGPDAGPAVGLGAGPGAGSDVGPRAGSDAGLGAGPDAGPAVGLGAGPGAGSDVGPRAGSDAGLAVGLGAGPDVGPGAGPDVGPGAGSDAGPAAGADAGLDAGPGAGPDAGPDVPGGAVVSQELRFGAAVASAAVRVAVESWAAGSAAATGEEGPAALALRNLGALHGFPWPSS